MENSDRYVVYMLKCKDNTLYTGYTNDLKHRLRMHKEGKGAKYTRGRGPFTLVYLEYFTTKEAAMKKEYEIKQFNRHEKEQLIRLTMKEGLYYEHPEEL